MEVEQEILERPIENKYIETKENIPIKTEPVPPKTIWQEPVKITKAPKGKKAKILAEP